ncbi:putative E3 ubiquitin-protein ligase [Podospora aff. communis PSN243]|uniref:HECT-type E3 ubiquitin transferase n=1 Tax=Podospora aff. communis PSN243 TaxID=3040156 RepID=A0AAV9H672_9PEZI|nr:putative E3 ubiquitin-protein ligase [Podospora aff. communis PSN243]
MAPWHGRVDSQRPAASDASASQSQSQRESQPHPRRPHANSIGRRYTGTSRISEFEVLDSYQIQAGSSSSEEDLHPRRPPRPAHSRSMSHPFPSLFSSKKKKSPQMGADPSDSESADETGPMPKLHKPQTRGHKNGSSPGSRDFSTGRCITCGSLVRWPRELQLFKCTICLTVNNLHPSERQSRRDGSQGPTTAPANGGRAVSPAEPYGYRHADSPISVEHTKSLIAQGLRDFLAPALSGRGRRLSADPQWPLGNWSNRSASGERDGHPSARKSFAMRPKPSETLGTSPQNHGPNGTTRNGNGFRPMSSASRSYSASYPEERPALLDVATREGRPGQSPDPPSPGEDGKRIFRRLEDYVIDCFSSFDCLNSSFSTHHARHRVKTSRDGGQRRRPEPRKELQPKEPQPNDYQIVDLDPKLLLLGDFAENGSWWTGGQEDTIPGRTASNRSESGPSTVSARNPRIDWQEVEEWYKSVVEAARSWPNVYNDLVGEDPSLAVSPATLEEIEAQILVGQEHAQRTLLKACEAIMKRPGRPLSGPHELRFLLIISANPMLHASHKAYTGEFDHLNGIPSQFNGPAHRGTGPVAGRHSGIIKRIVGLLSNTSPECHTHLMHWFARYPELQFLQLKDLVSAFLAYRLIRQNEKKHEVKFDVTDGLIPRMGAGRSPATLHAALGQTPGSGKKQKEKPKRIIYQDDWQIKAAAQILGLLFAANNMAQARRSQAGHLEASGTNRERVHVRGQIVATSDFYTTLLDDMDLVADFEAWERKKGKFSFCQYPFLLSVGAKIQILEYDARRQMESKARDAFFDSLMSHRVIQTHLVLNVRRDCLVDDSLKGVSEVIGGGAEDIKKGLKIVFAGEEGVDAGGLRKEWFLLLVRELFNPDYGMFLYDEDSQHCYFNPSSLEPSEQFFLVGVVFGLAIYNSTILDVALPPFAFRKLLMAAPPPATPTSQPRQAMSYTLEDLAEYRPRLAQGLRQLLDYDGDVEATFYLDFVVDTERYGIIEKVPLCPGGERRAVTNANRKEYVDLYVRYLLDSAVTRQFEPFKRGFFTVCGGNALSLFRPEEIELLVRGSDEALDISSLRAVAEYDNWGVPNPAEKEPIIGWFWGSFERASPADQRKLLLFITGSDRIPAMGAASLTIRISCLGEDTGRWPTARTCFNTLSLWRYGTRERLEKMVWGAVFESEGFGLK